MTLLTNKQYKEFQDMIFRNRIFFEKCDKCYTKNPNIFVTCKERSIEIENLT